MFRYWNSLQPLTSATPVGRSLEGAMQQRRRVKQVDTLEARLANEAKRLREQAKTLPPGPDRDIILRKTRQCETGSHMSEWLRSPELRPPE
jgi:hypothetical protein